MGKPQTKWYAAVIASPMRTHFERTNRSTFRIGGSLTRVVSKAIRPLANEAAPHRR